ncbi:MAG: TetR/AcrR family transcriptional regulator [Pseudomonadota bacterium]
MASKQEGRALAIERLTTHVLATGLSQLSLRQLAAAAGISDRMLLYYFHDKTEVIVEVLQHLGGALTGELEAAIPPTPKRSSQAMIAAASAMVRSPDVQPFMRLWIEVIAAAARDQAPYAQIAQQIGAGFLAWIEARLSDDEPDKPATAAMILAMIDGLALLEVCSDGETADIAARRMGREPG